MTMRMMNSRLKSGSWLWCSSLPFFLLLLLFFFFLRYVKDVVGCCTSEKCIALNCCRTQCVLYFSKQVLGSWMKWALSCKAGEVCDRHHQSKPWHRGRSPEHKTACTCCTPWRPWFMRSDDFGSAALFFAEPFDAGDYDNEVKQPSRQETKLITLRTLLNGACRGWSDSAEKQYWKI